MIQRSYKNYIMILSQRFSQKSEVEIFVRFWSFCKVLNVVKYVRMPIFIVGPASRVLA